MVKKRIASLLISAMAVVGMTLSSFAAEAGSPSNPSEMRRITVTERAVNVEPVNDATLEDGDYIRVVPIRNFEMDTIPEDTSDPTKSVVSTLKRADEQGEEGGTLEDATLDEVLSRALGNISAAAKAAFTDAESQITNVDPDREDNHVERYADLIKTDLTVDTTKISWKDVETYVATLNSADDAVKEAEGSNYTYDVQVTLPEAVTNDGETGLNNYLKSTAVIVFDEENNTFVPLLLEDIYNRESGTITLHLNSLGVLMFADISNALVQVS